ALQPLVDRLIHHAHPAGSELSSNRVVSDTPRRGALRIVGAFRRAWRAGLAWRAFEPPVEAAEPAGTHVGDRVLRHQSRSYIRRDRRRGHDPVPCDDALSEVRLTMRAPDMSRMLIVLALVNSAATGVAAQEQEPQTRQAEIEQAQADRVKDLHPYVPGKMEALLGRAEDILVNGVPSWHPDFPSAYYGGGFTLGIGYARHVSPYNMIDVRGSYTILGYKRIEAEFTAPRLFHRRGSLSVIGGWREATQAAFYGIGMDTSKADRTNFD